MIARLGLLAILLFGSVGLLAAAPNPNVLIILADDLGYGDVQCYNPQRGKISTPHLDKLAAQGMRFTDGHSSSGVCSPSRYGLLTGRYPWRSRLQRGIVQYLEEPLIAPERLTIAGLAQQHGYATACIGKWHLGWDWKLPGGARPLFHPGRGEAPQVTDAHRTAWNEVYSRPIAGGPTTRGFDSYFGTDVPNWPPFCFIENDRTLGIPSEFLPKPLLRRNLVSIGGPALADWKLEGILPSLGDRACAFIESSAKRQEPFLLYMPLTTPHTPLAVNEAWRGKSGLENDAADLIVETDAMVGRVLAALDRSGVADNTLVLFTSDNGFASYVGVKDLEARGHFPSGPLRGYKADAWEGGHRVPFIVRWPAVVEAGRISGQLVHHVDWMATMADVLGAKLLDTAGEDSVSLLPLLKGSDAPVREHAVSQGAAGMHALRRGEWKLIFAPDPTANRQPRKAATAPPAQLYHLGNDLAETNNLYASQPELVAELTALMTRIVDDGRSTPGATQTNDVPVNWRRFMTSADE